MLKCSWWAKTASHYQKWPHKPFPAYILMNFESSFDNLIIDDQLLTMVSQNDQERCSQKILWKKLIKYRIYSSFDAIQASTRVINHGCS